jgi:NAD(P)-dependent dehydrogenase (short-subunit alcohol dehydrogenase family)
LRKVGYSDTNGSQMTENNQSCFSGEREMRKILSNKVALITGGAQGMGKATAILFAENGVRVALTDINKMKLNETVNEIKEKGGSVIGIQADVTNSSEIKEMLNIVLDSYSTVDILVNNAGILKRTKIIDIPEDEWDLVIDVNLKSVFLCSRAVLPIMIKQKKGKIINMSSSAGRSVSTIGGAHYTASKAGVLGFTRHLAKEVAQYNINVNAVCPGLIDTEMVRLTCAKEKIEWYEKSFPISRLGEPAEVADLILFLASDESSYITGASIDINGGDLMI